MTTISPIDGNPNGTRNDLARWLRDNRRRLRLGLFDRWVPSDIQLPTHTFVSLLERKPFYDVDRSPSCAIHYVLMPY